MKNLSELQAANLPYASCNTIGLTVEPEPADDSAGAKQAVQQAISDSNHYLAEFTPGPDCPRCGRTLDGLLGSFRWGLCSGEGYCGQCGYPARVHHRNEPFGRFEMILPYHPSRLKTKQSDDRDQHHNPAK